jgi:hypothetical protein
MGGYHRRSAETPAEAALNAVSEVTGCGLLELPPIANAINSEAMDAFVDESRTLQEYSITFEYAGCDVTLSDDDVLVERLDGAN